MNSDREKVSEVLGEHRWKDMGIDWCSCECGEIMRGESLLTTFPADEAFRAHLAQRLAECFTPDEEASDEYWSRTDPGAQMRRSLDIAEAKLARIEALCDAYPNLSALHGFVRDVRVVLEDHS